MNSEIQFYLILNKIISNKREDNSIYLTSEKYNDIINEVKCAKLITKKPSLIYRRLKRYDIIQIEDEGKLIEPITDGNSKILYYIKNEDFI
jgi:hypothetical protein